MAKFETIIDRENNEALRPLNVKGVRRMFRNMKEVYNDFTGKIIIYTNRALNRKYTLCNGVLHSFNDEPAVWTHYGRNLWFHNGIIHRETGPALIHNYGEVVGLFYLNDKEMSLYEFLENVPLSNEEKLELVLKYG